MLDEFDKTIITLLERNGRMSNIDIAETISLSPVATHKRIKRLEQSGIIQRYTTILDKEKLQLATQIVLYITLNGQESIKLTEFEKGIATINNVVGCYLISGDYDYLVHVVIKDIPSYDRLYHSKIAKLPHIKLVKSNFIIREIKHSINPVIG